jgi:hypothetical protein
VDSDGTRRLIGRYHDASGSDAIGDGKLVDLPRPELYRQVHKAQAQPQHDAVSRQRRG